MNSYPKIQGLYKRYLQGKNKGDFIIGQYSKPEFEFLKDIEWVWTEKIDGTNIRVCWYRCPLVDKVEFKGKTDKAEIPKHLLERLQDLFPPEKLRNLFPLSETEPDICLYGEGYGHKIQSGGKYFPNNPKQVGFILFDIRIGNYWLKREDLVKIANQLRIGIVPIISVKTIDNAICDVKKGIKSAFGDFIAEGIVGKPRYELRDRRGYRIITKLKHKNFKEEK